MMRFFGVFCAVLLLGCGESQSGVGSSSGSQPSAVASAATPGPGQTSDPELSFRENGAAVSAKKLSEIVKAIPAETIKQYDPYYAREKTFRAVPLVRVLELGFAGKEKLIEKQFVLRAKDGYTVPLDGAKLYEPGAYIAFEDAEVPAWEPIGQQRANPSPFYLIWANKAQTNLETHPRPYQLATIEIAKFEDVFPFTVPKGAGDDAQKGFATFRQQCILCHAINRQGGRIGSELNVPQSIVEYRPVEQIKAYIKNPLTFRYSTMPPHPNMSEAELDQVIAYFTAMKDLKHDDEKAPQPASLPSVSASAAPSASAPPSAPKSSSAPALKAPQQKGGSDDLVDPFRGRN